MESWSHTVPTMKAFAVARDDAPAIEMIDVDAPTPRRDEAVIAVHAFSVNRGETFLLEREPAGWRPGKDISGSVVAACADGSGPAVGARVGAHVDAGGWAELVAVGSDRLVELPECVSHTDAATLPLAGLTALRLLRVAGPLYGRTVLLTGACGRGLAAPPGRTSEWSTGHLVLGRMCSRMSRPREPGRAARCCGCMTGAR